MVFEKYAKNEKSLGYSLSKNSQGYNDKWLLFSNPMKGYFLCRIIRVFLHEKYYLLSLFSEFISESCFLDGKKPNIAKLLDINFLSDVKNR